MGEGFILSGRGMEQPSELTNHIKQILCNLLAGTTEWDACVNFHILLCIIPAAPREKKGRGLDPLSRKYQEVNSVLDKLKDKH